MKSDLNPTHSRIRKYALVAMPNALCAQSLVLRCRRHGMRRRPVKKLAALPKQCLATANKIAPKKIGEKIVRALTSRFTAMATDQQKPMHLT
ncbi:hypothetical protein AVEN_30646-1 [Araneus ventricosus]|uniref:Uncharacterized protein n=1 Tax=Araneus ventricosus TaxID=182803 RepID=A0A4Y2QDD2_ARAVE|nr:hypothetical protein AVEN_30646-1 [Araneus ventricosus]